MPISIYIEIMSGVNRDTLGTQKQRVLTKRHGHMFTTLGIKVTKLH